MTSVLCLLVTASVADLPRIRWVGHSPVHRVHDLGLCR